MADSNAVNTINRLNFRVNEIATNDRYTNGSILIVANKALSFLHVTDTAEYYVYDKSCNKRYLINPSILTETLEVFSGCATIREVTEVEIASIKRSYNLIAPPLLFNQIVRNEKCLVNQPVVGHGSNYQPLVEINHLPCSYTAANTCLNEIADRHETSISCRDHTYRYHSSSNTNCIRCCNGNVCKLAPGTTSSIILPRCSNIEPCTSCGCTGCNVSYMGCSPKIPVPISTGLPGPRGPPGPQGAAFTPDVITSQDLFQLCQSQLANLGDGYSWLYILDQKLYFLIFQDNGVYIWSEGSKIVGPQGSGGIQGPAGLNGESGHAGPPGPQGPPGPAFEPNMIDSRTPTSFTQIELKDFGVGFAYLWTLNGSLYFVTILSDNTYGWSQPFQIVGATGTIGSTGGTGATGPNGKTGIQGAAFTVREYISSSPYLLTVDQLAERGEGWSILWTQNGNLFFIQYVNDIWCLSQPLGIVGPQGIQGNVGHPGPIGIRGLPGPRGISGNTGPIGKNGPTGPQGDVGAAFHPNLIGIRNPKSFSQREFAEFGDGYAYLWSINGMLYFAQLVGELYSWSTGYPIIGTTGAQGVSGYTGPRGYQGAGGVPGIPGLNGINGATGSIGPQGQNGEQGSAGPRGLQGPAYTPDLITNKTPGEFTQADLRCLGATSSVLFTQTCELRFIEIDPTNCIFYFGESFSIVGQQGEPGPTGSSGVPGIAGVEGPVGQRGPMGGKDSYWTLLNSQLNEKYMQFNDGGLFLASNENIQTALDNNCTIYIAPDLRSVQTSGLKTQIKNIYGTGLQFDMMDVGSNHIHWTTDIMSVEDGSVYSLSYHNEELTPEPTVVIQITPNDLSGETNMRIHSTKTTFENIAAKKIESISDERCKDITRIFDPVPPVEFNDHKMPWTDIMCNLNMVHFKYKDNPNEHDQVGLLAQNLVKSGLHDIVSTDSDGLYKVQYDRLSLYLIKALREIRYELFELKKKFNS